VAHPLTGALHVCCLTRITLGHRVKGGMEVHVDTLARGLADRGHRVTIVTTAREDGVVDETVAGVRTLYLADTPPGRYAHAWARALPAALARLHAETPIDVLWGEGAGAHYYLRWHRNPLRLPVVTFLQGSYLGELGSMWNTTRLNRRWPAFARYLGWRTVQYFRWDLWYTHGADHVIGASRENAALARHGYFLPRRKVTASVNGIDVQTFRPDAQAGGRVREALGLPAGAPVLLFCGRLEPEKGAEVAIRATAALAASHPGVQLIVAGTGSMATAYAALTAELGLAARVHFVGHVDNARLPAYYNACTVFLYPTLAVESFGIAVAEAMACARPVVASRLGGVQTSIDDPENGCLVRPGDVAALTARVARLLENPWQAARVGEAARKKAVEALSAPRMVDDVLAVFAKVIGRPAA
jgi:glycosyltransferase involved in cell wall biosynthesis